MVSLHESRFKLRFTTNFKVTPFRASMQNTRHDSTQAKREQGNRQQCQPQRRLASLARFLLYFSLHFRIRCPMRFCVDSLPLTRTFTSSVQSCEV
jgi:hypothetical protein